MNRSIADFIDFYADEGDNLVASIAARTSRLSGLRNFVLHRPTLHSTRRDLSVRMDAEGNDPIFTGVTSAVNLPAVTVTTTVTNVMATAIGSAATLVSNSAIMTPAVGEY